MKRFGHMALIAIGACVMVALVWPAQAAIIFDGSAGSGAAPATLGPYSMTPFPDDPGPNGAVVSVPSPLGGDVVFSPTLDRFPPGNWFLHEGYDGVVYLNVFSDHIDEITLTLPNNTGAFYFYVSTNSPGTFDFTASVNGDPGTEVTLPVLTDFVNQIGGQIFGFYTTGGDTLTSINITTSEDASGFGIGDFGIAQIPEPASLSLLAVGGLALIRRRR